MSHVYQTGCCCVSCNYRRKDAEIEQLRGLVYDLRALVTGALGGPEQIKGVLEWADDMIGSADANEQIATKE